MDYMLFASFIKRFFVKIAIISALNSENLLGTNYLRGDSKSGVDCLRAKILEIDQI